MKRFIEKYAYALVLVVCLFLLVGCNTVPLQERVGKDSTEQSSESVPSGAPNFQGMADALVCVFAPQDCEK